MLSAEDEYGDGDEPMPGVRYFALIPDDGTAQEATGLVRRLPTRPLPTDEAIHRDLEWHPTDYLERYHILGSMDRDHVEVTPEFAAALLARWRAERRPGGERAPGRGPGPGSG
jgi:hypothetical protein